MVRYPDTATITAITDTISDGEYQGTDNETTDIIGRLELSGVPARRRSSTGDWVESSATFFTNAEKIVNAKKLTTGGETFGIIAWTEFQSYSEIWLD